MRALGAEGVANMNLPQFTADASLYMAKASYRTSGGALSIESGVFAAAGTCTCTDPKCTWSCPTPPPPPFCYRGRPNCYGDCVTRCVEDSGGDPFDACPHNCRCCCTGHPCGAHPAPGCCLYI